MGNIYEEMPAVRGFSLNPPEGPGDQTSPGMRDEDPSQRLRVEEAVRVLYKLT